MISVFDIYKIGIGPSSSHTVGPMKAGKSFVDDLVKQEHLDGVDQIKVDVYGSLSLTGKGHHTDIAIILGLAGYSPESVDIDSITSFIDNVKSSKILPLSLNQKSAAFDYDEDLRFHNSNLSLHENGMQIHAFNQGELVHTKTYYSIGGGFIVDEEHFGVEPEDKVKVPYEFNTAKELVDLCQEHCLSISALVMENERVVKDTNKIEAEFEQIWNTMKACMERGLNTEGVLPGPLRVPRRAAALHQQLKTGERLSNDPMTVVDWVNMYAFAVNEENAAGGRVVTAPTNGACGIIPAVLAYYDKFVQPVGVKEFTRYFASSGAIGGLFKQNASISGAEVGCQGEVGVACSMAAAGLAELMGGSPEHVCIAAEIAMEHNLGLTCDPVAGQVQVPCIERNGIASVKAINACRMALRRSSDPRVSLDKVIETMLETGKDMNAKYRETSQGGLAIKVIC